MTEKSQPIDIINKQKINVVITEPARLSPSDGAKSAAKIYSGSPIDKLETERPLFKVQNLQSEEKNNNWSITSWQKKPIKQDVVYDDYEGVEKALEKLESLPPLVSPYEINALKEKLNAAALGKAFVLQGGDCAELFDYCSQEMIEGKIKVLLQMSLVLVWSLRLPIVRIGRIAGQFAKPRSKLTELVNGVEIPSFRGDNINGYDINDRKPDPSRLVSAYMHSAATLNYIRSILSSGFADLRNPMEWDLSHIQSSSIRERYEYIVNSISDGLSFMSTIGADHSTQLHTIDFFSSHEGLHLEYEQSLTRFLKDPKDGKHKWFNTSSHFLWIGDRTRQIDGAHVEYFRGLQNPIGIKVGPSMTGDEIARLLDIVDPNYETGHVTLITRYGADKISKHLPQHIKIVQNSGHKVVWIVDPCHGNTKTSPISALKTRYFEDIMSEIRQALSIHREQGSVLNGIHLELTGDAVTECIGGTEGLVDEDLSVRYQTVCDPRLSLNQSLDVAFLIADWIKEHGRR